ncbi:uncharacterized protein LOC119402853 isoform X1 [Rhipicephalus sanguineus]|uniref:uncharacterized protein LOC119402853 isoform X1 n=1 Tax=Rhipicephalus sanguineus TaxID=34632 RepID=UPI00189564BA|nr:uncharacterized protein LOC119402853 isoform X1 [Rhipicephalus sanguineus]
MQFSLANLFLLGLLSHLRTLDQGPAYVLAVSRKPAKGPLEKFPQNLQGRPWLLRHPALPPIREEINAPLYKLPGGLPRRPRLLRRPRLPPIPEEGEAPRMLNNRTIELRNRLLAGGGVRPITGFAHHRQPPPPQVGYALPHHPAHHGAGNLLHGGIHRAFRRPG